MKKSSISVCLAVLSAAFMIADKANAQPGCLVEFDNIELIIICGASDDVIRVFVKDVAQDDNLVPSLFVDIGDGAGPVNQGPAADLESVSIGTGDGSDDVSIRDLVTSFGVGVTTGRGPDKVSVGPNVQAEEAFAIDTGAGDDTIFLGLNVGSEIDVEVRTRSGADSVATFAAPGLGFDGVVAVRNIIIRGGAGIRDKIAVGPGSLRAGGNVVIVGFQDH